ncbi:hypothetical protein D3C78_1557130 [compost metagenome]
MPAGASTPYQPFTTKPGTLSATVGTSGSKGERRSPVTAMAFSLPACTCGNDVEMLSNISDTSPPSRATTAGPLPLYGTCIMSTPVWLLNISAARWLVLPLPADAKLSLPGWLLP